MTDERDRFSRADRITWKPSGKGKGRTGFVAVRVEKVRT